MENFQEQLNQHSAFQIISDIANIEGLEIYVIGGWVRDLLLNRPSKDIDIVCVGSGIELCKKVSDITGEEYQYFQNFGTAMIKVDGIEIEFVGARKESYQRDSRKPIVEEGTLADDQIRRDFSINAMAISLNKDNYGDLIDPFNGLEDLQNGIIRTPTDPNITFSDDPLRTLRAIRFVSQLSQYRRFNITPETFQAIKNNKERIEIISQERIVIELNKILLSQKPSIGFRLLLDTGLLELILPELYKMHGVDVRDGFYHKDNFYHTIEVLDNLCKLSNDLYLRWAALLHDIGKPKSKRFDPENGWSFHGHEDIGAKMVPNIFRRLKMPMDNTMKFVQKMVELHARPIVLTKEDVSDSAVRRVLYEAGDDIDSLLLLCKSDFTSKNLDKIKRHEENFKRVGKKIEEVEERDKIRNFQPALSGNDIMEILNIKPCKLVGEIKDAIKDAILDGKIQNTKEDCIEFINYLYLDVD